MSFLAPLYLLLGAAAAVPLLIHLLRRRIGTRVEFPAARYLARAEQEHSRSLRLRNLLLMLLRVTIVVVIALAAARPVARMAGAGHGPTALAIVLDNSLSTTVVENGRPLLEQFKARARDVLAQASSTDRLWLVTADGSVRGGSAATLRDALARVEPLAGAGDLRAALTRAAAGIRASGIAVRQIVLLTDGQRSAWQARADVGDVPVLLALASGAPPANRAVLTAEPRPLRWTPRGALVARIASRDSTTYRMSLGGRSLVRGTVAPGEEVVIHAAPPERGWVAGTVELEPDELHGDDVRHFALWIGAAPAVVVSPGAGPFAKSAVDVLRGAGRVAEGRDIVIVAADELASLPAVILAPSDPVRVGAANRALERAGVPWRFGLARRGEAAIAPATDFPDVDVSLRYDLVGQPGADADTLARVGRDPWIVSGARYVIVASPVDPAATSFPVRASFVPWLAAQLTERLVGEPGGALAAAPGAVLARPRWADAVEMPNGSRTALGDALVAPAQPGTYFLERAGRRVGALVVNPESVESMLDRASATDITARLGATRVLQARGPDVATLAFRSVARRSLLEPLLIAGLLLLVVEALLLSAGRRAVAA